MTRKRRATFDNQAFCGKDVKRLGMKYVLTT